MGFRSTSHPYIPNAAPAIKARMLREIGVTDIKELYSEIPEVLRLEGQMRMPEPLLSEQELVSHTRGLLSRNLNCVENICFLGAGCYHHYVPAICDEINQRAEFVSAYGGEQYDDFGRYQALFEYTSLLGELLNMDVVNVPTYDGYQAAATAIRMAARITNRSEVLISEATNPDKLAKITDYCRSDLTLASVTFDMQTGGTCQENLCTKISDRTAAIYFENPSYFGSLEDGATLADIAHAHGALCIVGADPICLGRISPPADYGADIVCGDIQSLGVHMNYGGGNAGFIASRNEEKFVREFPSRLFGITKTRVEGEYGFGDIAANRTSMALRENGREFVGTAAALWGITAGVYLALMGPHGMREIADHILGKTRFARLAIGSVPGVEIRHDNRTSFREFVVNFDRSGRTVHEINKKLLKRGIFGGKDLSAEFPALGQSALYCVTEMTSSDDLKALTDALREELA